MILIIDGVELKLTNIRTLSFDGSSSILSITTDQSPLPIAQSLKPKLPNLKASVSTQKSPAISNMTLETLDKKLLQILQKASGPIGSIVLTTGILGKGSPEN
jgi:hypothetical protein